MSQEQLNTSYVTTLETISSTNIISDDTTIETLDDYIKFVQQTLKSTLTAKVANNKNVYR